MVESARAVRVLRICGEVGVAAVWLGLLQLSQLADSSGSRACQQRLRWVADAGRHFKCRRPCCFLRRRSCRCLSQLPCHFRLDDGLFIFLKCVRVSVTSAFSRRRRCRFQRRLSCHFRCQQPFCFLLLPRLPCHFRLDDGLSNLSGSRACQQQLRCVADAGAAPASHVRVAA